MRCLIKTRSKWIIPNYFTWGVRKNSLFYQPRVNVLSTLLFLLSPAEESQASTSAWEPPPPNTAPTSEENLVHLGWQLKESQRKASRQRTDVQEEKHEKRRGAIDAVANASQHLRTIKATSATVAVRFLRGGGNALSRVCSCDLSSRPPSLFRINCQNCPGGRRLQMKKGKISLFFSLSSS